MSPFRQSCVRKNNIRRNISFWRFFVRTAFRFSNKSAKYGCEISLTNESFFAFFVLALINVTWTFPFNKNRCFSVKISLKFVICLPQKTLRNQISKIFKPILFGNISYQLLYVFFSIMFSNEYFYFANREENLSNRLSQIDQIGAINHTQGF